MRKRVSPGADFLTPSTNAVLFLPHTSRYKARLHAVSRNSNTGNNQYYSFNRGLTHFIVFSAEAYLYARSEVFLANQLAFMKADLAAVDRKVTPWVVGLCHKDWTMEAEAFAAFSPLLEAGGVDGEEGRSDSSHVASAARGVAVGEGKFMCEACLSEVARGNVFLNAL
jgi:hypothetical protein